MNLTAALDQFEDICLTALSNATFLDKKKKVRKSLGGRLKRLVLDVVLVSRRIRREKGIPIILRILREINILREIKTFVVGAKSWH